MATLLFTWELGSGLGHCANLKPLVEHFANAGHEVHVALRDVCLAKRAFGDTRIQLHQSPHLITPAKNAVHIPRTFAHVLHNTGFNSVDSLHCLVAAWRGLFGTVKPEIVVCEHSPSALLSSYTIDIPRIVVGTGFCTPPDIYPLPNLRPWEHVDPETLRRDEEGVYERASEVLAKYRRSCWDRLSQMYAAVDENILLTFREFDHYDRDLPESSYYGSWPMTGGACVTWPDGKGARVFGYLKPFVSFSHLVSLLSDLRVRALLYAPDVPFDLQRNLATGSVRFLQEPVDLHQVATDCDLAVLNANVSSAATFFLHGVPSFQVPMYLEQAIFARRFVALGGGLAADPDRPERIGSRLTTMLRTSRFKENAVRFSSAHATFSVHDEVQRAAAAITRLIA